MAVLYQSPPPDNSSLTPASPDQPSIQAKKNGYTKWGAIAVSVSSFIVGVGLGVWYLASQEIVSPLGDIRSILGLEDNQARYPKIVYGFLPYWNFKYADEISYQYLTHLALFGISFNEDGSIRTRESTYAEPGWRNLEINSSSIMRQAKSAGVKVILTITAFDNETIDAIVTSEDAKKRLISETLAYVRAKNFDGVNFDFEYVGEPTPTVQAGYSDLVVSLSEALKSANPEYHFSVDVYADSARSDKIWDMEVMGQAVDHIIVMAYDFHRSSSTTAGPVSPLYGKGSAWSYDITTTMAAHLGVNESEKILLGVPFYGYEWRTVDQASQSATVKGTGRLATYRRVRELLDSPSATISSHWSSVAMSPWLTYQDEDEDIYQIHYEDSQSLSLKFDYVHQADLAGIAIWALGYEGTAPEIWQAVDKHLQLRKE